MARFARENRAGSKQSVRCVNPVPVVISGARKSGNILGVLIRDFIGLQECYAKDFFNQQSICEHLSLAPLC
jgi:hypothetical protein